LHCDALEMTGMRCGAELACVWRSNGDRLSLESIRCGLTWPSIRVCCDNLRSIIWCVVRARVSKIENVLNWCAVWPQYNDAVAEIFA
jgi:hypothetical protein